MPKQAVERKLVAILAADVVGFRRMVKLSWGSVCCADEVIE